MRSGCKGTAFFFLIANYLLEKFLLWKFENALSLRDYKGKARIYKTKKQLIKKEIKLLSEMDVLENHKAYGSINFEDFYARNDMQAGQLEKARQTSPRGAFQKHSISRRRSTT